MLRSSSLCAYPNYIITSYACQQSPEISCPGKANSSAEECTERKASSESARRNARGAKRAANRRGTCAWGAKRAARNGQKRAAKRAAKTGNPKRCGKARQGRQRRTARSTEDTRQKRLAELPQAFFTRPPCRRRALYQSLKTGNYIKFENGKLHKV